MRILRVLKIATVFVQYGLDELAFAHPNTSTARRLTRHLFFWRSFSEARGVRLRRALETLGPIFVKFGQALSTRPDLIPADIAQELTLLQDRVPPFPGTQAVAMLEAIYKKPLSEVFASFEIEPIASASVAQVHFAVLKNGRPCAVKILRPQVHQRVARDVELLYTLARLIESWVPSARRLHPVEVVGEFERHLNEELDLLVESANASKLRRNFADRRLLIIPEVFWDWCEPSVMVMERMEGIPISQVDELRRRGIDIPKLARDGVEIFFTQVFRDGFFHADMHPGNIQVAPDGRYVGLDFGIVGTLSKTDKHYLASIFLAFFRQDYQRVAQAHIEAGWVPAGTRVEEFEGAIRSVCEPVFDKPLSEISFGKVLLRLFAVSRRFNMEIQPQLVMLQKTLLNVEGLGRQLDPQLDLWQTGMPYLERWMKQQMGFRGMFRNLKETIPDWATLLPQLPRMIHEALTRPQQSDDALKAELVELKRRQKSQQRWLTALLITFGMMLGASLAGYF